MSDRFGHATVISLVLLAILSRWLPHPPNFSPVMAIALFAGARFGSARLGVVIAVMAMFMSDLYLGFHSTMPFVYVSLVIAALLGWDQLRPARFAWGRLAGMSSVAAIIFFVVTNLGVWMTQDLYPKNGAGLVACYVAGIPFFPATWASSLIYSFALFALWSLVDQGREQVEKRTSTFFV